MKRAPASKPSSAARSAAAKPAPARAVPAAAAAIAAAAPAKPKHPQIFDGCQLVFWDTAFIGALVDAVKARGAKVAKEVELGVTTHVIATNDLSRENALQRLSGAATAQGQDLPEGMHFVRREFLTRSNIKGQRLQESDFVVQFATPQPQQQQQQQPSSSSSPAQGTDALQAPHTSLPSSSDAEPHQHRGPRVVGVKRARSDSEDEEDFSHPGPSAYHPTAAALTASADTEAAGPSRPPGRARWGTKNGGRKESPPPEVPNGGLDRRGMAALAPKPLPEGAVAELTHVVSIDCEMVGYGYRGLWSQLAWVAIVNNDGHVIFDSFVAPRQPVTDWRTWVSGVRPSDVEGAPSFEEVRAQVAGIIAGRVLVGHSIGNDLRVLELRHPPEDVRDTAAYRPLMAQRKRSGGRYGQNLKALVKQELGIDIQEAEHSPVDDARATLYVYHKHQDAWEESLLQQQG